MGRTNHKRKHKRRYKHRDDPDKKVVENFPAAPSDPQKCRAMGHLLPHSRSVGHDARYTLGFPGGLVPMEEMRETQVPSLGWEGPLEKRMAAHSSILAR